MIENIPQKILVLIYKTYESEFKRVSEIAEKKYGINYQTFKYYTDFLKCRNLIKIENITLPILGGKRTIIEATEQGEFVAMKYTEEILQEREAEKIKRQHDNYTHGYFIKKVVEELRKEDIEVVTEPESLKFETNLLGDKGKILYTDLDLIANNKPIEVEVGKTSYKDMVHKLDKINNIKEELYIIVPTQKAKDKILKDINKWREEDRENTLKIEVLNYSKKELSKLKDTI